MLRPDTLALTALLALLTALGPLAMDLYLPSLPEIGLQLIAPPAQVQLTISGYLIGFAAGQIVYGPLADRFGRKPPLIAALAIFCVATLLCAAAGSIETLIAARALQAVGSSGAVVLARAIVRDLYQGARAGRELSLMGMIMGFAPMIAPLIGGVLQETLGWRSGFAVIFAGGVFAMAAVWQALPETGLRAKIEPLAAVGFIRDYGIVGRNRSFRAHTGIVMASYAGLFAFISGSSFVMQDLYGLTPVGFAVFMAITAVGYVGGTFLAARTVERMGLDRTIGAGALALAGGGTAMVVCVALTPHATAAIALPMMLYVAGLGLAAPQSLAGAMQPFPDRAGAASSLVGCLQQTSGAVVGAMVGQLLGESAWPLVVSIAAMGWLSLIVWMVTRRSRSGREAA